MKRNNSKRHHYLPRNYLKGFTDSNNSFFVYDKEHDKIFKTTPDAMFFENNLNTVILPKGNSSDFLEDMYTNTENTSWRTLDKIRSSNNNVFIEPIDRMNLFLFLLVLHWRLPGNIEYAENLSKEAFPNGEGQLDYFKIVNQDGGRAPEEFIELIKNSEAFKKTIKMLLPFTPFYKDKYWVERLTKWRFFYTEDGKDWFIVGDNPIITKGEWDHDPVNCLKEFVFPVSGKVLLVNTVDPVNSGLPAEFVIKYNVGIFERARRFIACQRKDFLEALVEHYKLHVHFKKTDTIIPEIFKALE